MEFSLPLDRMTAEEKLHAVERIWDDLCREPGQVPSPEWHGPTLEERERRVAEGSTRFIDWLEAKQRLKELKP